MTDRVLGKAGQWTLVGNFAIAALNGALAVLRLVSDRSPWATVNAVAFGVSIYCGVWIWRRQRAPKEQKWDLTPDQPTSGKSTNLAPSPSPSVTLTGFLSGGNVPYPTLSASPSLPSPERRAMPVIGYRAWNLAEGFKVGVGYRHRLGSWNAQFGSWEPGANEAHCYASHYGQQVTVPHGPVPGPECGCGYYVLTDLDRVPFEPKPIVTRRDAPVPEPGPPMLVGAVVGWGRVIQHGNEGWRAQKVRVIALLDCKVSDEHLRATREAAEAYGVPVLERPALEWFVKEHGDRLQLEPKT